uniref:hypothetical protein n=1 Tax=Streptococcus pluranimalium TaxID=82348 RepID=UPI003F68DA81
MTKKLRTILVSLFLLLVFVFLATWREDSRTKNAIKKVWIITDLHQLSPDLQDGKKVPLKPFKRRRLVRICGMVKTE